MRVHGGLRKMRVEDGAPVRYWLRTGDGEEAELNDLLSKRLILEADGQIRCVACGRETAKSFGQGHCYPCFIKLASCDRCIVSPELCHHHLGTCREPEWGLEHCMREHVVYLANSSGLKVGITRANQVPTRWIDQGASQAVPVFLVPDRRSSGLLEAHLKASYADRTDWRAMLRGEPERLDLETERARLVARTEELVDVLSSHGLEGGLEPMTAEPVRAFSYPVLGYPERVRSINLDKTPHVEGVLHGVKGQYLILDAGVLNIRRHAGYQVSVHS